MTVNAASDTSQKPQIHLSETDYDVIAALALQSQARDPDLSQAILDEIERAEIHAADDLPGDVVRIGSEVLFRDDVTSAERTVQLVMPAAAHIEEGRLSVMTSVGAGLIGMPVGGRIDWPYPDGRPRSLTILAVRQL